MTGITDENGVRYARFKYDTSWRAVGTEHVGPFGPVQQYTVSYSGNTTTERATGVRGESVVFFDRALIADLHQQAIEEYDRVDGFQLWGGLVAACAAWLLKKRTAGQASK